MPIFEIECQECNNKEELICSYETLLKTIADCCVKCGGQLHKYPSKPSAPIIKGNMTFSVSAEKQARRHDK